MDSVRAHPRSLYKECKSTMHNLRLELNNFSPKRIMGNLKMTIFTLQIPLSLIFGILGNIFSVLVYVAPLRTFYGIYKTKSTQGFKSAPYVFALLSAMSWIYYALLKSNSPLLISINSFGCVAEVIYIAMFMAYAPRQTRIRTAKLVLLLNVGLFSLVVLFTIFFVKGTHRLRIFGWISVVISTTVFAAPFSIMRVVVQTGSIEFMPFSLSFFLTGSAIMWLCYGVVLKDWFVAIPNILGVIFGVLQMVLYAIYRNKPTTEKMPEQMTGLTKLKSGATSGMHPTQDNVTQDHHVIVVTDQEEHKAETVETKLAPGLYNVGLATLALSSESIRGAITFP